MSSIQLADESDIPRLNILINSAYRGEDSKKGWTTEADLVGGIRSDEHLLKRLLQKPGSFFLKYSQDNKILGCVHLKKEKRRLYLGLLSVDPESQGKGIGKELMYASEIEAKNRDCDSIYMNVISLRQELIDWYLRHGYKMTGEKIPFDDKDLRFGIPKIPLEFIVFEKNMI